MDTDFSMLEAERKWIHYNKLLESTVDLYPQCLGSMWITINAQINPGGCEHCLFSDPMIGNLQSGTIRHLIIQFFLDLPLALYLKLLSFTLYYESVDENYNFILASTYYYMINWLLC